MLLGVWPEKSVFNMAASAEGITVATGRHGRALLGTSTARNTYIGLGAVIGAIFVLSLVCCLLHYRRSRTRCDADAELSKELTDVLSSHRVSVRSVSSTLTSPRMMARALAREDGLDESGPVDPDGSRIRTLKATPTHLAVQPRRSSQMMGMLASSRRHAVGHDFRCKLPTIPSVTSLASKETRSDFSDQRMSGTGANTATDSEIGGHLTDSRFTIASGGSRIQQNTFERDGAVETSLHSVLTKDDIVLREQLIAGGATFGEALPKLPPRTLSPTNITMDRVMQLETEQNDLGFQAARHSRRQERLP